MFEIERAVCCRAIACAVMGIAAILPDLAAAASFDCAKSHTFVEKAICGDSGLSKLDERLAADYRTALSVTLRPDDLRKEQRQWLTSVRNACGDVSCLKHEHEARVAELASLIDQETRARRQDPSRGQATACALEGLPPSRDVAVLAAGGGAGRPLDFQIDDSGHVATQMEVVLHHPQKPVVLMLGAYEPTIWSVRRSASTVIAGVFLSGYHRPLISGIDGVPILHSSFDNQGPCGYFYASGSGLNELNPLARRVVGKPVDMAYPSANGRVVIGAEPPPGEELIAPGLRPAQSFRDDNVPLAGVPGLLEAVRKGQLRRATPEDARAWASLPSATRPQRDVPPTAGEQPGSRRLVPLLLDAYVVLTKFRYPAGLYGGNSATFLIPKGVPAPTGNPGHSTVWDFNTGLCTGTICSAERGAVTINVETTPDGRSSCSARREAPRGSRLDADVQPPGVLARRPPPCSVPPRSTCFSAHNGSTGLPGAIGTVRSP